MSESQVLFNWRTGGRGENGAFAQVGLHVEARASSETYEKPALRLTALHTRGKAPCQMEIPVESVPAVADAMLQRVGELPPEQKQKIYIKWRGRGILSPQMSPVGYLFATQAEANAFLRGLRVMESQSGVTNSFVQTDETGREL